MVAADRWMEEEPEEWRFEVGPLLNDGCRAKGRLFEHRRQHKNELREISRSHFRAAGRLEDDLILTTVRFKRYKKFWDGQASESASEEFENLLDEQQGTHSGNGVAMVAVSDNPRLRTFAGRSDESKSRRAVGDSR